MQEKPPHPDTDPELYLDQVRFFADKDGNKLGVIPAFAVKHYVELVHRKRMTRIHELSTADIKTFIDSNRNISWEANLHDGEFCIGETKVEQYFFDILKKLHHAQQQFSNAHGMRLFYQGIARGAMERSEELSFSVQQLSNMLLALKSEEKVTVDNVLALFAQKQFQERFATWVQDNNWKHISDGVWEHGDGPTKTYSRTSELFAECVKDDPK